MGILLIANRGEVAIRIARATRELGLRSVGICAEDDAASLHTSYMDECHTLPRSGPAAYLDQEAVLEVARRGGCTLVHPGYGFLSENAEFARRCTDDGLIFVGPTADVLDQFGDKITARVLAGAVDVPVMPGTSEPTSLADARAFAETHGAVMLKAMAGGGGRGMRAVRTVAELNTAYESCRSEAMQAFGLNDLYVEKLLTDARHIEVQVIGDGTGAVCHLWERDCSVQRRHQKVIEIAPAPHLSPPLRERMLSAAVALAQHVRYRGLCTIEFLVSGEDFWFMEANPRLQVEHTITEEITGVDLVQSQLRIAMGDTLTDLGLDQPPAPHGFAIQARVNLETLGADGAPIPQAGVLTNYTPPGGPNVRVDGYGYPGYRTSLRYDSLLAKVIGRGRTFGRAAVNTAAALREFGIGGVDTNQPLLKGILRHPAFLSGEFNTSLIGLHLPELLAEAANWQTPSLPGGVLASDTQRKARFELGEGETALAAPMSGTVMSLLTEQGAVVAAGDPIMILEAMKMEHLIRAPETCLVETLAVSVGDSVNKGDLLCGMRPADAGGVSASAPRDVVEPEPGWQEEVDEIHRRRALAKRMGGAAKVERQKQQGKLTARERIEELVDAGTFSEIGTLTGFGQYDEDGNLIDILPANFVAGTARVGGRKLVIGSDDFTIRAGSGDAAIHAKQIFAENYAREMRLPMVRLLDGASGGGSVKIAQELGYHYLPVNPGWDAVVDLMSLVPVVSACLGPTVGLGAARLVMSHLAVMVDGTGQVFTAGPPIVLGATNEDLTKEELGGTEVHRTNGMIERIVGSEAEAIDVTRRFLSYLPQNVFQLPPVGEARASVPHDGDALLSAIPRNLRQPYDVQPILDAIFDAGSIFLYADYGSSVVTYLARLDGHPVGVISTDPMRGAALTVEAAQAMTRLVDLCETFHLPIVSLTDQAGMSIGLEAERRGTIRYGARAISAVYQSRIPQAELILRRVFGVGGAGAVNRHRASRSWSWPSGTWGSLPKQGGIEAAFRTELSRTQDRDAEIARLSRELEQIGSPFRTAEKFGIQDLIDPRESRALLCDWVRDAYAILPEQLGRPAFGPRP
ncbi:carboxyl transferase domain-containing protein [Defluviimonas salinarum]|uniref:acetyl-CoA carboxylase n=1 Tax=Defluviimonas salinarum TaxID=2992147 RepID=A0ABT3J7J1_9RHOB|nr:carboxyl transferase domain-containing protein [Defluviimonas salinarum]MCW3783652.1 ATP-grasp domain-containing protein [Defluviimonas salinarum]